MKNKLKECAECGEMFDTSFRNTNSKYCGDKCRKEIRKRDSKINREKRKLRLKYGSKDYIATEVFKKYRERSPKRGLIFELTVDFFKSKINEDCYYCGNEYKGIGFDRLDNNIGYVESNVVPCCTICNLMKRNADVDFFINRCKEIAENFINKKQ